MNFVDRHRRYNLNLLGRNEGKLKSYESCIDIRAWSHDCWRRSGYLREWIKSDMPLCILPVGTLVGFFRAMTCRRNRSAACCHPDCKSKAILESITVACNAINECMKTDENLHKFFVEEEIETSHWPCERCLDALKSIKLFWRIMLEKVFFINLTKSECYGKTNGCVTDSVRDVARNWQKDMVYETQFVKSMSPQLQFGASQTSMQKPCSRKVSKCHMPSPCSEGDARNFSVSHKASNTTYSTKQCTRNCLLDNALFQSCSHCNIQKMQSRQSCSRCNIQKMQSRQSCSHSSIPKMQCRQSRSYCNIPKMQCKRFKSCSSTNLSKEYEICEHLPINPCLRQDPKNKGARPKSCPYNTRLSKICQTGISSNENKRNSLKVTSSSYNLKKPCSSNHCRFRTKPPNCLSRSNLHSKSCRPFLNPCNSKPYVCPSAYKLATSCNLPPSSNACSACKHNKTKIIDACCGTAYPDSEATCTKSKIGSLQKMFNKQKQDIEKLKKENCSLKCELQNLYRNCNWKCIYGTNQSRMPCKDVTVMVPKPFESSIDACGSTNLAKDADSELVITMKNCKHEYFRHVNLLQVLHKSNDPFLQDCNLGGPCYKNEDPIRLLQKVKTTLGAMVTREMALNRQKRCDSSSDIVASFQRVSSSKSEPTSSFSSRCTLNSCRSNKCDRHRMRK